jgi:predicted dehydrogenase
MSKPIRYAVVGLGHIAQVAVLPAFAHAKRNSELTAVVSGDRTKRREVSKRYRVEHSYSYGEYEQCLKQVDAVYIALPNSMHAEYAIRAAKAGVHVLCEKPMSVTTGDCQKMVKACHDHDVKLMIGYRLHFEEINLAVMNLIRKGRIGRPKYFPDGRNTTKTIAKRDQFAPSYFTFPNAFYETRHRNRAAKKEPRT